MGILLEIEIKVRFPWSLLSYPFQPTLFWYLIWIQTLLGGFLDLTLMYHPANSQSERKNFESRSEFWENLWLVRSCLYFLKFFPVSPPIQILVSLWIPGSRISKPAPSEQLHNSLTGGPYYSLAKGFL